MEFFRNVVNGWFGKAVLGVVIVLFSAYGVESLMVLANQKKAAAEVNGEDISAAALERSIEFERRSILSRMGDNPDLSQAAPEVLRPRVLDALIDRLLLAQIAERIGGYADSQAITAWIVTFPQFQTDGKFDKTLFERTVQQLGMSSVEFSKELHKDFVVNQLRQGLADSAFITQPELERLLLLQQQARNFRYVTLPHTAFLSQIKLSDAELQNYYRQHQDQYRREERAKFQYVELTSKPYEAQVTIADADVQKAYKDYAEAISKQESREAAHILINIDADTTEAQARERMQTVQTQLNAGEDFATLAKKFSEDTGSAEQGGYLGFSERGGDFLPSFDEALFAIPKVQGLSPIIKTDYGLHLIKLLAIKKPEVQSLEDKRADLIAQLKKTQALTLYQQALDELKAAAFESGDLQSLIDKFKLKLNITDWISSTPAAEGIFANEKVLKAAFNDSLRDGFNSEPIEIEPGRAIVLRQVAYEPSQVRAFDEVKSIIQQVLMADKAQVEVEKAGRDLIAKARAGESLPATWQGQPLTWIKQEKITRASGGVPPAVLSKIFAMPRPVKAIAADLKQVPVVDGISNGNDFILMELLDVLDEKPSLSAEEMAQMQGFLATQFGRVAFDDFFRFHQADAKIVRR